MKAVPFTQHILFHTEQQAGPNLPTLHLERPRGVDVLARTSRSLRASIEAVEGSLRGAWCANRRPFKYTVLGVLAYSASQPYTLGIWDNDVVVVFTVPFSATPVQTG